MEGHRQCAVCGREAIGIQAFGCRASAVCKDHAHSILLARGPGERYSTGECLFERFSPSGSPPRKPDDQAG